MLTICSEKTQHRKGLRVSNIKQTVATNETKVNVNAYTVIITMMLCHIGDSNE